MPVTSSNMMGLLILSIGILSLIVSFLVTDKKKQIIAFTLAGFIVFAGVYQFANTSYRQWQSSRRIAKLQKQQRMNLTALQERLRKAQADTQAPAAAAPKSK